MWQYLCLDDESENGSIAMVPLLGLLPNHFYLRDAAHAEQTVWHAALRRLPGQHRGERGLPDHQDVPDEDELPAPPGSVLPPSGCRAVDSMPARHANLRLLRPYPHVSSELCRVCGSGPPIPCDFLNAPSRPVL